MPLFLYNFQSKQLHGIFKAASDGALWAFARQNLVLAV